MYNICKYCQALKFSNKATGMCCASGKVVLSLPTPLEPFKSLLAGDQTIQNYFYARRPLAKVKFAISHLMEITFNLHSNSKAKCITRLDH